MKPSRSLHGTLAGLFHEWRRGQVVRQRPAKPSPPVRIRASPPKSIGDSLLKRVAFLLILTDPEHAESVWAAAREHAVTALAAQLLGGIPNNLKFPVDSNETST